MDDYQDLEEALAGEDTEHLDEIPDADTATRMLRWHRAKTRRLEDLDALWGSEVQRLQDRFKEIAGPLAAEIQHLEETLGKYHAAVIADAQANGATKLPTGLDFPTGTLSSRAGSLTVHYEETGDSGLFIEWAKTEWPELVQTTTTETVNKADVKALLKSGALAGNSPEMVTPKKGTEPVAGRSTLVDTETGATVAGVYVERGPRTFNVKK